MTVSQRLTTFECFAKLLVYIFLDCAVLYQLRSEQPYCHAIFVSNDDPYQGLLPTAKEQVGVHQEVYGHCSSRASSPVPLYHLFCSWIVVPRQRMHKVSKYLSMTVDI